ncbi:MAG: response regulator [Bacteroidota bacterium]
MSNNQLEILLVEDNSNDAELTIRALIKHKIVNHIIHLKDGEEAIDFLFGTGKYLGRDTENKPKLILLDLKMPKVNGIEVLEKIKLDPSTKTIPVVILTSSREHPDVERCYKLGANSYIVKPVEFENFSLAVKKLGLYWMLLNQPPIK